MRESISFGPWRNSFAEAYHPPHLEALVRDKYDSHCRTLKDIVKTFPLGKLTVEALRGVSLNISQESLSPLQRPSGSGKTTLLNQIGCVDQPTKGNVFISGQSTSSLSERELTALRLNKIGFIFQTFNLMSVLDVYQNVNSHSSSRRTLCGRREARVMKLLADVGSPSSVFTRPNELSEVSDNALRLHEHWSLIRKLSWLTNPLLTSIRWATESSKC